MASRQIATTQIKVEDGKTFQAGDRVSMSSDIPEQSREWLERGGFVVAEKVWNKISASADAAGVEVDGVVAIFTMACCRGLKHEDALLEVEDHLGLDESPEPVDEPEPDEPMVTQWSEDEPEEQTPDIESLTYLGTVHGPTEDESDEE